MRRYAGDVVIRNCDPARASPCVAHLHPPGAYRAAQELGGADAGVTTTLAPELLDGQVMPTIPDMPCATSVSIAIPIEDKHGVTGLERERVRGRGRQLLRPRKVLRAHVAKTAAKQHDPWSLDTHLAT